jgi:WG containing repeat
MSNQKSIPIVWSSLRTLVRLSASIVTVFLIPVCQVRALTTLDTKVEKMSSEINSERTIFKIARHSQLASPPLAQPAITERLPQSWHIAEAGSPENLGTSNSENLAVIQVGKKYGYQDAEGHTAIEARFDNAYEFFDGLAAVKVGNKWGFIDRYGKPIVAIKFDNASSFNDGLAAVKIDNKWGFIDRQGIIAIVPSFDNAETFSEGLSKIKVGNKWGFIDRQGSMKIEPTFDEAASFNNNTAWVRIGKQVGYIDKVGKFLITSQ